MFTITAGYVNNNFLSKITLLRKQIEVLTTYVDETMYLVTVRYSSKEWFLVPCKEKQETHKIKKEQKSVDILTFIPNSFIIRDLSTLELNKKTYAFVEADEQCQ